MDVPLILTCTVDLLCYVGPWKLHITSTLQVLLSLRLVR